MGDILNQYDKDHHLYKGLIEKISNIISDTIEQNNLSLYSITNRVKTRESLSRKIGKENSNYADLKDITDIGGIRVTTYFEDDVKKIADILEAQFIVDKANSLDKKAILDPDRFGYLSMHHVVSFDSNRCKLPEYRKFDGLKAEIQTRSILQHAWAEIEHDLGYKTEQGVPKSIRRRFSRLAGLLELADEEFITIRDEISAYSLQVKEQIKISPNTVDLDVISLKTFVETSEIVRNLDLRIAEQINLWVKNDFNLIDDMDVERLSYFGLASIDQVESSLKEHYDQIIKFAKEWLNRFDNDEDDGEPFSSGVSLFYLCYVLAGKTGDLDLISNYTLKFLRNKDLGDDVLSTYNTVAN